MAHGLALKMEEMLRGNQHASSDGSKVFGFKEPTNMGKPFEKDWPPYDSEMIAIINAWRQLISNFRKNKTDFLTLVRRTLLYILSSNWERMSSSLKTQLFEAMAAYQGAFSHIIGNRSKKICDNVIDVGHHPWKNNFFTWETLFQGRLTYEDKQVQAYFESELEEVVIARAHSLFISGHQETAMKLVKCSFNYYSKIATGSSFCKIKKLRSESSKARDKRGFITMEWYIFLLKRKSSAEIINELKHLSCHEGIELVNRLRKSPRTVASAYSALQVFILNDLLYPSKYCCTKKLFVLWCEIMKQLDVQPPEIIETVQNILAKHAPTSAHFYLFGDVLWEQFGTKILSLHVELYIRGLTSDINHLEVMRNSDALGDMDSLENHIAIIFDKLSSLFSDSHEQVARECMFSAFSLRPTKRRLYVLQSLTHSLVSNDCYDQEVSRPTNGKKECSCGVCTCSETGTCIKLNASDVFHPLLTRGIKNVRFYLVRDLVCILESVRCINFQYNIFNWNKHSVELGDYLTLKSPQISHGSFSKDWESDSETECASDYSYHEYGAMNVDEDWKSNSIPVGVSPTAAVPVKRKSKGDYTSEIFCLDVGANIEVKSDDNANKKLKIHMTKTALKEQQMPPYTRISTLSRPTSISDESTIMASTQQLPLNTGNISLNWPVSTLEKNTSSPPFDKSSKYKLKSPTVQYQRRDQMSLDFRNSNSNKSASNVEESILPSVFEVSSRLKSQKKSLDVEHQRETKVSPNAHNINLSNPTLTSERIVSSLLKAESNKSSNYNVHPYLITNYAKDERSSSGNSTSTFAIQSRMSSPLNLKNDFTRVANQLTQNNDSQSNTSQNRDSAFIESSKISHAPTKSNSNILLYTRPQPNKMAESPLVKTVTFPVSKAVIKKLPSEFPVQRRQLPPQFSNQEALNLSSNGKYSNIQQTQETSVYRSQTVKIKQTERISIPGRQSKEICSVTEIEQTLTKNKRISYMASRTSDPPSYSHLPKPSQYSGIHRASSSAASPIIDVNASTIFERKNFTPNKFATSTGPSSEILQSSKRTTVSSCDGASQQFPQRDRNSVIVQHSTQMQNATDKTYMNVQPKKSQMQMSIPVSIDKTVVQIGNAPKKELSAYRIILSPSDIPNKLIYPANLVIPKNPQSSPSNSNSSHSDSLSASQNQPSNESMTIPGYVLDRSKLKYALEPMSGMNARSAWSGQIKKHGQIQCTKSIPDTTRVYQISKMNVPQGIILNEQAAISTSKLISSSRSRVSDQNVFAPVYEHSNSSNSRSNEMPTLSSQPWYSAPYPKQRALPTVQGNCDVPTYSSNYLTAEPRNSPISLKTNHMPNSKNIVYVTPQFNNDQLQLPDLSRTTSFNTSSKAQPHLNNNTLPPDAYLLKNRFLPKAQANHQTDVRKSSAYNNPQSSSTQAVRDLHLQAQQSTPTKSFQNNSVTPKNFNTSLLSEALKQPSQHVSNLTYSLASTSPGCQVKACCSPLEANPCHNCSVTDTSRHVSQSKGPHTDGKGLPGGSYTHSNSMVFDAFQQADLLERNSQQSPDPEEDGYKLFDSPKKDILWYCQCCRKSFSSSYLLKLHIEKLHSEGLLNESSKQNGVHKQTIKAHSSVSNFADVHRIATNLKTTTSENPVNNAKGKSLDSANRNPSKIFEGNHEDNLNIENVFKMCLDLINNDQDLNQIVKDVECLEKIESCPLPLDSYANNSFSETSSFNAIVKKVELQSDDFMPNLSMDNAANFLNTPAVFQQHQIANDTPKESAEQKSPEVNTDFTGILNMINTDQKLYNIVQELDALHDTPVQFDDCDSTDISDSKQDSSSSSCSTMDLKRTLPDSLAKEKCLGLKNNCEVSNGNQANSTSDHEQEKMVSKDCHICKAKFSSIMEYNSHMKIFHSPLNSENKSKSTIFDFIEDPGNDVKCSMFALKNAKIMPSFKNNISSTTKSSELVNINNSPCQSGVSDFSVKSFINSNNKVKKNFTKTPTQKCKYCDKFLTSQYMKTHIKKMHNDILKCNGDDKSQADNKNKSMLSPSSVRSDSKNSFTPFTVQHEQDIDSSTCLSASDALKTNMNFELTNDNRAESGIATDNVQTKSNLRFCFDKSTVKEKGKELQNSHPLNPKKSLDNKCFKNFKGLSQKLNPISVMCRECHICHKTLSSSSVLQRHVKTVHGSKECNICHEIFSSLSCLNEHLKLTHGIQKPPRKLRSSANVNGLEIKSTKQDKSDIICPQVNSLPIKQELYVGVAGSNNGSYTDDLLARTDIIENIMKQNRNAKDTKPKGVQLGFSDSRKMLQNDIKSQTGKLNVKHLKTCESLSQRSKQASIPRECYVCHTMLGSIHILKRHLQKEHSIVKSLAQLRNSAKDIYQSVQANVMLQAKKYSYPVANGYPSQKGIQLDVMKSKNSSLTHNLYDQINLHVNVVEQDKDTVLKPPDSTNLLPNNYISFKSQSKIFQDSKHLKTGPSQKRKQHLSRECSQCHRMLCSPANLRRHSMTVHGILPFSNNLKNSKNYIQQVDKANNISMNQEKKVVSPQTNNSSLQKENNVDVMHCDNFSSNNSLLDLSDKKDSVVELNQNAKSTSSKMKNVVLKLPNSEELFQNGYFNIKSQTKGDFPDILCNGNESLNSNEPIDCRINISKNTSMECSKTCTDVFENVLNTHTRFESYSYGLNYESPEESQSNSCEIEKVMEQKSSLDREDRQLQEFEVTQDEQHFKYDHLHDINGCIGKDSQMSFKEQLSLSQKSPSITVKYNLDNFNSFSSSSEHITADEKQLKEICVTDKDDKLRMIPVPSENEQNLNRESVIKSNYFNIGDSGISHCNKNSNEFELTKDELKNSNIFKPSEMLSYNCFTDNWENSMRKYMLKIRNVYLHDNIEGINKQENNKVVVQANGNGNVFNEGSEKFKPFVRLEKLNTNRKSEQYKLQKKLREITTLKSNNEFNIQKNKYLNDLYAHVKIIAEANINMQDKNEEIYLLERSVKFPTQRESEPMNLLVERKENTQEKEKCTPYVNKEKCIPAERENIKDDAKDERMTTQDERQNTLEVNEESFQGESRRRNRENTQDKRKENTQDEREKLSTSDEREENIQDERENKQDERERKSTSDEMAAECTPDEMAEESTPDEMAEESTPDEREEESTPDEREEESTSDEGQRVQEIKNTLNEIVNNTSDERMESTSDEKAEESTPDEMEEESTPDKMAEESTPDEREVENTADEREQNTQGEGQSTRDERVQEIKNTLNEIVNNTSDEWMASTPDEKEEGHTPFESKENNTPDKSENNTPEESENNTPDETEERTPDEKEKHIPPDERDDESMEENMEGGKDKMSSQVKAMQEYTQEELDIHAENTFEEKVNSLVNSDVIVSLFKKRQKQNHERNKGNVFDVYEQNNIHEIIKNKTTQNEINESKKHEKSNKQSKSKENSVQVNNVELNTQEAISLNMVNFGMQETIVSHDENEENYPKITHKEIATQVKYNKFETLVKIIESKPQEKNNIKKQDSEKYSTPENGLKKRLNEEILEDTIKAFNCIDDLSIVSHSRRKRRSLEALSNYVDSTKLIESVKEPDVDKCDSDGLSWPKCNDQNSYPMFNEECKELSLFNEACASLSEVLKDEPFKIQTTTHQIVLSSSKVGQCDVCHKILPTRYSLEKHLKRFHSLSRHNDKVDYMSCSNLSNQVMGNTDISESTAHSSTELFSNMKESHKTSHSPDRAIFRQVKKTEHKTATKKLSRTHDTLVSNHEHCFPPSNISSKNTDSEFLATNNELYDFKKKSKLSNLSKITLKKNNISTSSKSDESESMSLKTDNSSLNISYVTSSPIIKKQAVIPPKTSNRVPKLNHKKLKCKYCGKAYINPNWLKKHSILCSANNPKTEPNIPHVKKKMKFGGRNLRERQKLSPLGNLKTSTMTQASSVPIEVITLHDDQETSNDNQETSYDDQETSNDDKESSNSHGLKFCAPTIEKLSPQNENEERFRMDFVKMESYRKKMCSKYTKKKAKYTKSSGSLLTNPPLKLLHKDINQSKYINFCPLDPIVQDQSVKSVKNKKGTNSLSKRKQRSYGTVHRSKFQSNNDTESNTSSEHSKDSMVDKTLKTPKTISRFLKTCKQPILRLKRIIDPASINSIQNNNDHTVDTPEESDKFSSCTQTDVNNLHCVQHNIGERSIPTSSIPSKLVQADCIQETQSDITDEPKSPKSSKTEEAFTIKDCNVLLERLPF